MDVPKIPGYEILARLPQGGMSNVFKARQISLDRVVVLKVLTPAMGVDLVDVDKFMAEAKITAQLKHPNIVQVYDFGRTPDGVYYFVMEFISGYSVAEWIQRKKCLSRDDALLCARCVAEALNYAWTTAGVVHCDIKPDNVMIDGDGTVKVADLGLARSVRSVTDQNKSGAVVAIGTPYYISPEQSQGRVALDCRADIYSLGAMLYHCLTGKLPFDGLPPLEVMDRQITDFIPDIAELKPQTSLAVACLIEKMMAKDPACRQKDWQEVIRDIIRMRTELLPEGPLPSLGVSTMLRGAARKKALDAVNSTAHIIPAATPNLPPAASGKNKQRDLQRTAPSSVIDKEPGKRFKFEWLASGIMVLAVVVAVAIVGYILMKPGMTSNASDSRMISNMAEEVSGLLPASIAKSGSQSGTQANISAGDRSGSQKSLEEAQTQRRIEATRQWCRTNSGQYDEGMRRFAKLASELKGTTFARAAENEIARIKERKRAAVDADMQALREKVQPLLDRQQWRQAAELYERYTGQFKAETLEERTASMRDWRERDDALVSRMNKAADEKKRRWQALLADISAQIVEDNPAMALALVREATNQIVFAAERPDLHKLESMVGEACGVDQRILGSFQSQKGQEIVIATTNGPECVAVQEVRDNAIMVEKIIIVSAGQLGRSQLIRMQDLTLEEKKNRLGTNLTPEITLAHGLVALRDGDFAAAKKSWKGVGPLLAAPLAAGLAEHENRQGEERARSDFILLLRAAQIDVSGFYSSATSGSLAPPNVSDDAPVDASGAALAKTGKAELVAANDELLPGCERILAAIYQRQYSPQMAEMLIKRVTVYQERHGQTKFAKAYAPALAALRQAHAPVAGSNRAPAAASSFFHPDGDSVREELLARNPGLTEYNISLVADRDGRIVRAELIAADLKDIRPLAALSDLREIVCSVARTDEWREFPIQAPMSDISPLRGLPLKEVSIGYTKVRDLSALTGLPLTKLDLTGTRVMDLTVLKGMPLRDLSLSRLDVRDLKPLAGLPLESLNISHTDISDLTPLAGMKLKRLIATSSRVRDLKVLAGMPLKELNISRTEVADLGPLMGMELYQLDLSQTRIRDLGPLATLPLRGLLLNGTDVRDLSPLRGLALQMLNVRGTRVKDLNPLRDMPLKWLDISDSDVRDLLPLRGVPLKSLSLWRTAVRDLTPIQNSPIEEIWLDYNADQQTSADTYKAYTAALLRMPRLQKVNGNSEFRDKRRHE